MRLLLCVVLVVSMHAVCCVESASAQQGSYSGKAVTGMFGPRTLGQPLQSPVRRSDRGIARDAYGDFVGVNQAYSGRIFGGAKPNAPPANAAPVAVPPVQPAVEPQFPEVQPGPDQWLRSQEEEGEVAPPMLPAAPALPDSSLLPSPRGPGRNAMVVGHSSRLSSPDPLAQRLAAALERTSRIQKLSPIRVDMKGEVATLRGRVATLQDRELAENLIRFEPGVWDVRNELAVGAIR